MEHELRKIRRILVVTLVLLCILYACVADLMAGGPVSSWIARVSAEQAQKQRAADAYRRWLRENEK